jgi:hypothetical protein
MAFPESMIAGNPDRKRDQFRSADMKLANRMQEVSFKRSCHEGAYALLYPAGNDGPCKRGEDKNHNPAENARAFDENRSKVKRQKICTESNHNSTPFRWKFITRYLFMLSVVMENNFRENCRDCRGLLTVSIVMWQIQQILRKEAGSWQKTGRKQHSAILLFVGHDLHCDPSRPGAVEFAEKDALPGSEEQLAVFNQQCLGGADQGRFDMGVGIPFGMGEVRGIGNHLVEESADIRLDSRVGPFVDNNAGGGMEHEEMADPVEDAGNTQQFKDIAGDVDEFRPGPACYVDVTDHSPSNRQKTSGAAPACLE